MTEKFKFGTCTVPDGKRGQWSIDTFTISREDASGSGPRFVAMAEIKGYIVKRAFSSPYGGILVVDGTVYGDGFLRVDHKREVEGMGEVVVRSDYYSPKQWADSREKALAMAEVERAKQIAAAQRRIKYLEGHALVFRT